MSGAPYYFESSTQLTFPMYAVFLPLAEQEYKSQHPTCGMVFWYSSASPHRSNKEEKKSSASKC